MDDEKKVGNGHVLEWEKGLRMVPTGLMIPGSYYRCTVKPERLGGTQIPHGVGRELRWHPH